MIEQKIENLVIEELSSAVDNDKIQFIGVWQKNDDGLKSFEDSNSYGIVTVKVYPRTYDTPTIPYANFQVDISLTMRAEIDSSGISYFDVTERISNILQSWQNSFENFDTTFSQIEQLQPTGFSLDSGDVGIDRDNCVWQYTHTFTVYGII